MFSKRRQGRLVKRVVEWAILASHGGESRQPLGIQTLGVLRGDVSAPLHEPYDIRGIRSSTLIL
jgi:hypothetical protein